MRNKNEYIPLKDKKQTITKIYECCLRYNHDLEDIILKTRPIYTLPLQDYYDLVRMIPYSEDNEGLEIIGRPKRIITFPSLDCKKKAILIGSFCAYHNYPYRFAVVSQRKDMEFHHIFPEIKINGKWISFDATYSDYYIGQIKPYTAKEVY